MPSLSAPRTTAPMPGDVAAEPPPGASTRRGPYAPHRSLLTPGRVRELSVLRPARVLRDTAACWLLIGAGWALAAWSIRTDAAPLGLPAWALVLPVALALIGTRYYALFILGHDGMHRRIFNSGAASELFTDVFHIGCIGMVCRVNARNHLLHHQHLATDADPDLHKHACFTKATRAEYLLFLTGLASVVTVLANLFRRDDPGAARRAPSELDEHAPVARGRYSVRDACIILTWQTLLVLGLTALVGLARGARSPADVALAGWWGYPLLWAAPVYVFAYLPNLIRSFTEHSHPEGDDLGDEHRLVTFLSNPLERWFMSPMNMNYHIAHHLWPSIPYYNLPIADAEIRASGRTQGLTWRGTYIAYLLRYWLALPIRACLNDRRRRARSPRRAEPAQ